MNYKHKLIIKISLKIMFFPGAVTIFLGQYGLITIPEENHQMSSEGENGFTPPVSPNKSQ